MEETKKVYIVIVPCDEIAQDDSSQEDIDRNTKKIMELFDDNGGVAMDEDYPVLQFAFNGTDDAENFCNAAIAYFHWAYMCKKPAMLGERENGQN